jgi:hypothetical protein
VATVKLDQNWLTLGRKALVQTASLWECKNFLGRITHLVGTWCSASVLSLTTADAQQRVPTANAFTAPLEKGTFDWVLTLIEDNEDDWWRPR